MRTHLPLVTVFAASPSWAETFDLDGDGESEQVALQGSLVVVTPARGQPVTLDLGGPASRVEFGQVQRGARRIMLVRSEGEAPTATVIEWAQGRLDRLWSGRIGPQGSDGEWGIDVELEANEIVRFETKPGVERCDGKPARLFARTFDFATRTFRHQQPGPAPPASAPTVRAVSGPGGPPLGFDPHTPPTLMRFGAASTDVDDGGSAAGLDPPVELDDGDDRTAWSESLRHSDGTGEFLTAFGREASFRVVALRIVPGDAKGFRESNRLRRLQVLTETEKFLIELSEDPIKPEPYWAVFPHPIEARCLTVVIESVYPARNRRTAISELAVLTDIDRAPGQRLAELIAQGGRDADAALKVLAHRPGAVHTLLSTLSGARLAQEQRRLRLALATLGDPAAAHALALGLAELSGSADDARAAKVYESALSRMGHALIEPVAALLLNEGQPDSARQAAARLLASRPEPKARSTLVAAAGRGSRSVRAAVAHALGATVETQTGLDRLLKDIPHAADVSAEADLWWALALGAPLADMRARAAQEAALRLKSAEGYELRHRLVQAIAALAGEPAANEALRDLLAREAEPILRQVALEAVAPRAANVALASITDPDPGVRAAAVAAFAKADAAVPEDVDVDVLSQRLLDDTWPMVRKAAADALSNRCTREAVVLALHAAADRDPTDDVAEAALGALVSCGHPGVGAKLLAVAGDPHRNRNRRSAALRLLARLADPSLAPEVAHMLQLLRRESLASADGVSLAIHAAKTLGFLGGEAAEAALLAALEDSRVPDIQAAAAEGLGHLCAPAALAALSRARASEHRQLAYAAHQALRRCGN